MDRSARHCTRKRRLAYGRLLRELVSSVQVECVLRPQPHPVMRISMFSTTSAPKHSAHRMGTQDGGADLCSNEPGVQAREDCFRESAEAD